MPSATQHRDALTPFLCAARLAGLLHPRLPTPLEFLLFRALAFRAPLYAPGFVIGEEPIYAGLDLANEAAQAGI